MSELPQGWMLSNLGELVDYGATAKVEPASIGNDEWVLELEDIEKDTSKLIQRLSFRDRKSKSTKNRFSVGDVLYGKLRPNLNKVLLADGNGVCTTEIVPLRCPTGLLPPYLFYALKRSDFLDYVSQASHGIDMPRLGTEAGRAAAVPLPPLPEQRRIVAKIDSLTGKSRRARDHLDHIPRLVEKYKQAVLAAAFRGDLVRSTARAVPLGSVCDVRSGFAFASSDFLSSGPVPVVRIGDISDGVVNFSEGSRYLPEALLQSARQFIVKDGDILVALSGATTGKSGIYNQKRPALLNQRVARLRLDDDIDRILIAYFLQSIRDEVLRASYGGAQPNISPKKLAAFPLIWPEAKHRRVMAKKISAALAWIDRLASEVTSAHRLIDQLDQAVLAKAFRGELVSQDPADEPASVLLDRIKAERGAAPKARRGRKANASA